MEKRRNISSSASRRARSARSSRRLTCASPRAQPLADLYFALKPLSVNLGEVDHDALIHGRPQAIRRNPQGRFQLFRIGDAVSARNTHAAIYDALRLLKDL